MNATTMRTILEHGIQPQQIRLQRRLLDELLEAFTAWPEHASAPSNGDVAEQDQQAMVVMWVRFLDHHVEALGQRINRLKRHHVRFLQRYEASATRDERQRHMLDYAADLGAGPQQLAEDRKAFSRWFDLDALKDRFNRRVAETERRLAFALDRLGVLAAQALQGRDETERASLWRRFALEARIRPLLAHEGDDRVAEAAFHCLGQALLAMPADLRQTSVSDTTLQYIYRSALESRHGVGIQTSALVLLPTLAMESFKLVVRKRLEEPKRRRDDIFVRRKVAMLLADFLHQDEGLYELLPLALADSSSYVRQGLAKGLSRQRFADVRPWLERLALQDRDPKVRGAALVYLVREGRLAGEKRSWALRLFEQALTQDKDPFSLRCAMLGATDAFCTLVQDEGFSSTEQSIWQRTLLGCLKMLHASAEPVSLRRYAALSAERIWAYGHEQARALMQGLEKELRSIQPGFSKRLLKRAIPIDDRETFARVLSVLAQRDFGFDVRETRRAWVVTRGFVFEFRFWRLWHELRHPSPDKRQAFPHLIGRRFTGTLHAPSSILAEVTPTKVPGEPLVIEEEGGWRPYLPLVDELISALNNGLRSKPIEICSSEGLTLVVPPRSILRRLLALAKLNLGYANYARLRNWDHGDTHGPGDYIQALRELGFTIEHRQHTYPQIGTLEPDASLMRFFPLLLPWDDWWVRFSDYAFSPYENTLYELLLFALIALIAFVGRHIWINRELKHIRKHLPLVIGGWGTRGKSGVERLKASVFNGLGVGVVSKTTGCEAMFLHGQPFRRLRELFLFRPYDKASIWEQADLLRISKRLQPDVFLWECMGLSPHYVRVLQHDWMRDDMSTITNTFPDHENLQGPAGINIPMVMNDFIPEQGLLLTSEEQMTPILREKVRSLGNEIREVGWLEAGLLTDDVLALFPYAEHPYNIALVLAVAAELGMDEDTALRYMTDYVVPDIGVLKRFPEAPIRGRRLEFVNGMSANERYGCLQNWKRMGFADHDPVAEPGTWISTLVNNRADRVSRSIVFADLLVRDLSADRHFLIGTNLHGLLGYIRRAWDEHAKELSLFPVDDTSDRLETALQRLARQAVRLRVPIHESQLIEGLRTMLGSAEDTMALDIDAAVEDWRDVDRLRLHLEDADESWRDCVLEQHRRRLGQYHEYLNLVQRVRSDAATDAVGLDVAFREQLRRWFMDKLVIIEDPHASGEQIIDHIVRTTPPGFLNRIMGIQNIKGTGLDFVYRWQEWEQCHEACEFLRSDDPYTVGQGMNTLTLMTGFGQLCEEHLRKTLEEVRHSPLGSRQRFQAELNLIADKLETSMAEVRHELRHRRKRGILERIVDLIEAFVDAGDAVKRRKLANRIYKDLVAECISHERAAAELRRLTQRQKGGWLLDSLDRIRDYLRRE